MTPILSSLALLVGLTAAGSALAGPFDLSPNRYGALVNDVLSQEGSGLRFEQRDCTKMIVTECRFSSKRTSVTVSGRDEPPLTSRIIVESDLLRDEPDVDPLATMTDTMLVLGATSTVFDHQLEPESRVELLSDLIAMALDAGASEGEGVDARYAATFDQAVSGMLVIEVTPVQETNPNWTPSALMRLRYH